MTLSDRVAAASGPDRELDLAIERAVGTYTAFSHYRLGDDDCEEYVPTRYTASIDAAMTLVPEGCGVYLNRYWTVQHDGPVWSAELAFGGIPDDPRRVFDCFDAATPALALTSAALKARNL